MRPWPSQAKNWTPEQEERKSPKTEGTLAERKLDLHQLGTLSFAAGGREMLLDAAVVPMEDSAVLLNTPCGVAQLATRLNESGYVLLRGFFSREAVLDVRSLVLDVMVSMDMVPAADAVSESACPCPVRGRGKMLTNYGPITNNARALKLMESPRLFSLFKDMARLESAAAPGRPRTVSTYEVKSVRVMAPNEQTSIHSDAFRFGTGSKAKRYTCWAPLGDVSFEQGPLVVCEGSHRLTGYASRTVDELPSDFSEWAPGRHWRSASFRAGDIVIFDMRAVHGSAPNMSTSYRMSCDTRWIVGDEDREEQSALYHK